MPMLHVASEVGRLRRVLLHGPHHGPQASHTGARATASDAVAQELRSHGVEVLDARALLAETLQDLDARRWLLDRVVRAVDLGAALAGALRLELEELDGDRLAAHLVSGAAVTERPLDGRVEPLHGPGPMTQPVTHPPPAPVEPCWIYDGRADQGAPPFRRGEALHLEAIYRFHGAFAGDHFDRWCGDSDDSDPLATAVVVGLGERTTAQATELVAGRVVASSAVERLIAVELLDRLAFVHLDTVIAVGARTRVVLTAPIGGTPRDVPGVTESAEESP